MGAVATAVIRSTDQLGQRIDLPAPARRIVSLVPSQTELLFDLGAGAAVVGCTRYCVHPAQRVAGIARVGGTKKFDFAAIDALAPDLIIANREENYADGVARLREKYPVWVSDIVSLADALAMIRAVGTLTGRAEQATSIAAEIETGFAGLTRAPARRVAYFIWRKPWMVVGGGTFIDHIVQRLGWVNVFGGLARYPEVNARALADAAPELLLLSSEPFPFREAHARELLALVPGARVLQVDGEMFSWYGSRLRLAPAYLRSLAQHRSN